MRRGIGHYSQLIYNNRLNSYSGKDPGILWSRDSTKNNWPRGGGGGAGVAKYQITCFHRKC